MKLEWDDAKNKSNLEKHGLDFEDAKEIFQAPMLTALDTRFDYGEDRWVGFGSLRGRVVVMVYTTPDRDTVRIISLRKAVKREQVGYEKALRDRLG